MNKAFSLMRKAGLVAYQNYECCQSCAGAAIAAEIERRIAEGKATRDGIKGCCFFHAQDAEDRDARRPFFLAYGDVDVSGIGDIGLDTVEVGRIVCGCLAAAGVKYEWDGNPNTRIKVTDPGGTKYEEEAQERRAEAERVAVTKKSNAKRAMALGIRVVPNEASYGPYVGVNADDLAKLLDSYEAQQSKRKVA